MKYRQDRGGFYIMWKLQREGFNWNMMGRLNFSWWNDTQLEMTEVWSHGKTRLASDLHLEVSLEIKDGNFGTRWLLPQCLWNRNSTCNCHGTLSSLSEQIEETDVYQDLCWEHLVSMCVAGLLSASRRRTRSAAVCTERPGACSGPLSHEGFRWALTKSFCWRCLETVLLTSFGSW